MALRGNHTLGGSQACENIALIHRDGLAVLQCVSLKKNNCRQHIPPIQRSLAKGDYRCFRRQL